VIPEYTVFDWSGQIGVGRRTRFAFGVNNLTNARYFTKRTGEYPGPGILPGIQRSFYVSVAVAY
jgi:Fe(3+) dicitrate transport protein